MEKALFPILLLPMLAGGAMFLWPIPDRKHRNVYVFCVTLVTSILTAVLLFSGNAEAQTVLHLSDNVSLAFRMDGLSRVFGAIVAVLWPIAVLYAFEYMRGDPKENRFFAFYTITYGVVLGIAMAENLFTLYFFYELLTLATLPLVMQEMDGKARYAGKKYILYSMSGAALSFVAMVLVLNAGTLSFVPGGNGAVTGKIARIVFLLGFFGFGAKAAVWPLHSWLPSAGVAPTPVTALLHAVAVVNSGLFAIMRLVYYVVGASELSGTAVQTVALAFACFTIVFGSVFALRNHNLKRRLAYSTVSNLSYILLGVLLMTPRGLAAGLLHMVMHSVIKIILFFCAGAILCATHHNRRSVADYEGLGHKFPLLFSVFGVASLALIGLPPFGGFTSKFAIATAAASLGGAMSVLGVLALCISAFLTGLYLVGVVIRAFFPTDGAFVLPDSEIRKNGWQINATFIILTVLLVLVSFFANDIYAALLSVAELC